MEYSPRIKALLDNLKEQEEKEKLEKQEHRKKILTEYTGSDRVVHVSEKLAEIEEEKKHKPSFFAFGGKGLEILDSVIEGFRKGQLVVLSGPPKNGKSGMCMTFTKSFLNAGYKCLWFQYELTYQDFLDKFPFEEVEKDKLDFRFPRQMTTGNLNWIEERIDEATYKGNKPDIVFIDHLDFIKDPDTMKEFRYQSANMAFYVGAIVQKVKQMAVEKDIIIFLMTHLRKSKWTTNELPSSEEIRDTGRTAQLADIVLMMVRRRNKSTNVYDENKAMLGVMENRHNGKTKKIDVELRGKIFVESDSQPEPMLNVAEVKESEQITF